MRTELLPIVDCVGSPRARGRAHGETLRTTIADKVGRWRNAIGDAYGIPADTFLPRFLAATNFRDAIERFTPALAEEVSGIAQGAAIGEDTAYAMQLMDEEWWFGEEPRDGHCSSLAIAPTPDQPTMVAQTMDLSGWHDGAQALLRFPDRDGNETLVFTSAGMIGLMGVSTGGLGICVNTLSQLRTSRTGLPVAFVMRGALGCSDASEAVSFLRSVPHASGQNYQLGDRDGIATLECCAAGATQLTVENGRSLHTNHPLESREARPDTVSPLFSDNSRKRLESLRSDLGGDLRVTPDAVKIALSACRAGGEVSIARDPASSATTAMTIGAILYEIGDEVAVSVCAGPPSVEAWRQVTPARS
ncbi:C45 family peptidase [Mesorhizobium sp. CAU 1732]|uniref:C45 family peptidase n=1 Tax=Mesorhizobium sp. CAU 1732 TaxID=3140358 RepID=UPI003261A3F9